MQQGKVVNCSSSVNVRGGPGTKYKKIGKAPKGAVYNVILRTGSWYQIEFEGKTGYIHNKYLSVSASGDPAPPAPPAGAQTGTVVNCKKNVNVRSGPGTGYKKLGSAPKGAVYPVTGKSGSWYAILFGGRAAYISSSYLAVSTAPAPVQSRIVEGYYGAWAAYSGYTPANIPAGRLTHITYAFADVGDDLKVAMGDPEVDPSSFARLKELKAQHPGLQTLISINSEAGPKKFSDAALSEGSRSAFADSAVRFMKENSFDGVDIDWEYPTSAGRKEDRTNFTALMAKLRERLDAQGSLDGRRYLLSFAGAWGTFYTDNVELNRLGSYADFAFVMAYDMHMPSGGYTDFNSPLYMPGDNAPQYKWSCDEAIRLWTNCGFPKSKIVMGVPFYGYRYSGAGNTNNGLYQTFSSGVAETYDAITANYLGKGAFARYTQDQSKVPWLFDGSTFISYDDGDSIAQKAAYAKNAGLAGAGVWELSQNASGALLGILSDNLK
jgi:chitinase